MINGSVLDQQNRPIYELAQAVITNFKRAKLYARHDKNAGHSWALQDLLEHLMLECGELAGALDTRGDTLAALLELADIANMVDIIAMHLLDYELNPEGL